MSLEGIIVDLGETVFEKGMTYVALSRARDIKNVILTDFDPNIIKCNVDVIKEYNKLRLKYTPDIKPFDKYNRIPVKYLNKSDKITKIIKADLKNTKLATSKIILNTPKSKTKKIQTKTTTKKKLKDKKTIVETENQDQIEITIDQDSKNSNEEEMLKKTTEINKIKCNINYLIKSFLNSLIFYLF